MCIIKIYANDYKYECRCIKKIKSNDWDDLNKKKIRMNKIIVELILKTTLFLLIALICIMAKLYIIIIILILIYFNIIYKKGSLIAMETITDEIANDKYINFLYAYLNGTDDDIYIDYKIYLLLDEIVGDIYRNLCLNDDQKSCIKDVITDALLRKKTIIETVLYNTVRDCLILKIEAEKGKRSYLAREDVNILLIVKRILREREKEYYQELHQKNVKCKV
ncbi:hypothetical protein [Candidatus Methanocrinis natronophilus]|uniref:Uncharacterized protein n=1 Tax=Candidatus Methanocrinis natronophilus TaxID=3033396 RepID=A0ABT5X8A0_9EURY|nr:hypothetical protein [Candidatus Methanocrinis natronophilus]MDF0590912.1 hypothetical protein [Candidatus Methanocrinis natronophilus]